MWRRINQAGEMKKVMNSVVMFQLSAFLVAMLLFYASNILVFMSPSAPLLNFIDHNLTALLRPQLKITPFGLHLTINGNFWVPLVVNSAMPYAFFAAGSVAFALALALDLHPDTAPNWYGILKAKYEVGSIREALKSITSNKSFLLLLISLQALAFILTVASLYHYAVSYIVNGGLQWEILVGATIINPAIIIAPASLTMLATKVIMYRKLRSLLPSLQASP